MSRRKAKLAISMVHPFKVRAPVLVLHESRHVARIDRTGKLPFPIDAVALAMGLAGRAAGMLFTSSKTPPFQGRSGQARTGRRAPPRISRRRSALTCEKRFWSGLSENRW